MCQHAVRALAYIGTKIDNFKVVKHPTLSFLSSYMLECLFLYFKRILIAGTPEERNVYIPLQDILDVNFGDNYILQNLKILSCVVSWKFHLSFLGCHF